MLLGSKERVISFVIGALGVRAYGSLLRRTLDLDLAVGRADWPVLSAGRAGVEGGEVAAIWWDRLGLMLDESERQAALEVVGRVQARGG